MSSAARPLPFYLSFRVPSSGLLAWEKLCGLAQTPAVGGRSPFLFALCVASTSLSGGWIV